MGLFSSKKGEKEARRQADIARQTEESQQILNQFLAQLIPGSEEFNRLQTEGITLVRGTAGEGDQQDQIRQLGSQLVAAQQARVAGGGAATPLEARTQQQIGKLREAAAFRPEEQAIFNALRGQPAGDQLSAEGFRKQMTPPLSAEEAIQRIQSGQSGGLSFTGEGLPRLVTGEYGGPQPQLDPKNYIEGLRSGKIQARLSPTSLPSRFSLSGSQTPSEDIFSDIVRRAQSPEEAFQSTFDPQLQLLQDAVRSRAAQRGVLGSGLELENLGRAGIDLVIKEAQERETFRQRQLENFQNLYNTSQQLRGREIGLEGDIANIQLGRESRLTDLLGRQTENRLTGMTDLLGGRTSLAETRLDEAIQAEEARRARIAQTLGQAAALGASFIPGIGPVAGPALSALVAAQQTPMQGQGNLPALPTQLTRLPSPQSRGQLSPDELRRLLGGQ